MEAILLKKEYLFTEGRFKIFISKHKNGNIEIYRAKSDPEFEKKCIEYVKNCKF